MKPKTKKQQSRPRSAGTINHASYKIKRKPAKFKARKAPQRWYNRKSVRLAAYALGAVIILLIALQLLLLAVRAQAKFCYVRSDKMICIADPGKFYQSRIIYNLPKPGGYELTSLIPSPDQKYYIALSSSAQTGLGNYPTQVWLLGSKLQVLHKFNFTAGDGPSGDRVFAVWSPDSTHVLMKDATGGLGDFDYDVASRQLTPIPGDEFCDQGYYGFDAAGKIISACGDYGTRLITANPDGSHGKTIATINNGNASSGSFVATKDGPVLYHLGSTLYAINPDGKDNHRLAAKTDFDYFKYDAANDMLFLVKKNQNAKGYTLGVKSVAYISVDNLLAGGQPILATLDSQIHAEDTPYITPVNATQIVLSGLNGSELYNLQTGNGTMLSPAPSEVVPSDVSANLEGITGMVKNTYGLKWNPLHQSFTIADQIRGLNTAPKEFQTYIKSQFASQNPVCAQNPGRFGSQLDMKILGVQGNKAAVIISCQVSGYWGRDGAAHLYQRVNGSWHVFVPNPALYAYGVWPNCEALKDAGGFSKTLVPKCINISGNEQVNPIE